MRIEFQITTLLCLLFGIIGMDSKGCNPNHSSFSNLVKSSVKICSLWCLLWSIYFLYYYKEKFFPRAIRSVFKDYFKYYACLVKEAIVRQGFFFILSSIRDSRTRTHNLILGIPSHHQTRSNWLILWRSSPCFPCPYFFQREFKKNSHYSYCMSHTSWSQDSDICNDASKPSILSNASNSFIHIIWILFSLISFTNISVLQDSCSTTVVLTHNS